MGIFKLNLSVRRYKSNKRKECVFIKHFFLEN